jgi:hypothetical protein
MNSKAPDMQNIPDYSELAISRDEILEDLGRRMEQADRVIELGNTLKQNVYSAGRKCGISKEEINRAKFLNTVKDLGPEFLNEVDPADLDRTKK